MRNHRIILALIATLSSSAAIAAPSTSNSDDNVSVTVSTGRGRLGFAAIQISPELRTHLGAPSDRGVLVDSVRPDSPAARAGLRVGDVVLSVDGDTAKSAMTILDALSDRKKGEAVAIDIQRGAQRLSVKATLDDDPGMDVRAFGRFDRGQPFDVFGPGMFDKDMRRSLEELRKRLDAMEKKLETKRT